MVLFPRWDFPGNTGKKPKIIFLAGLPDTEKSGWGDQIPENLSKDYDLYFLCYPGFETNGKVPHWGYSFDELAEGLHLTITDIMSNKKSNSSSTSSYYFIGHDWGAFLGLYYQTHYPPTSSSSSSSSSSTYHMEKLILLDVGMMDLPTARTHDLLICALYQLWFAWAFIFSRFSLLLGTLFMKLFFYSSFFKFLWPLDEILSEVHQKELRGDKCYPCFNFWKCMLTGNPPKITFPKCPTLYFYGTKKRVRFHDDDFIKKLHERKDCDVCEMPGIGHWLQLERPDETIERIRRFIQS